MTLGDTLQETYAALSANKTRSGLTILGIVIGISSVIAMVSIGTGASNSISSSVNALGSNLLQVYPGAQRQAGGFAVSFGRGGSKILTQGDADAIASQVQSVTAVATEVSGRYQVTAKGTNTNTSVNGVSDTYAQVRNVQVAEGSFITNSQNDSASKVAVLGPTTMTDLFGEDVQAADVIGKTVRINGMEFSRP